MLHLTDSLKRMPSVYVIGLLDSN